MFGPNSMTPRVLSYGITLTQVDVVGMYCPSFELSLNQDKRLTSDVGFTRGDGSPSWWTQYAHSVLDFTTSCFLQ